MKFLCFLLLLGHIVGARAEDHLTLYFTPSPKGIDWRTPSSLLWSAIQNRLTGDKRFIGHVYVELNCGEKNELTGMTSGNFDYIHQLLWESRGFGIFYHSFEGKLEEKSELRPELDERLKSGQVNFSRYLISAGHCERLTTYLKEFREHKVYRHYGLVHRPLYAEGAGCSAYGVSFLEVAGLLDVETKESWENFVNIPYEYLGPPARDEKVSLIKLLLFSSEWVPENKNHKKLVFWDPDRMHKVVKDRVSKSLPIGTTLLKLENSQGLLIDKKAWPVPEHPIWRPIKK